MEHRTLVVLVLPVLVLVNSDVVLVGIPHREVVSSEVPILLVRPSSIQVLRSVVGSVCRHIVVLVCPYDQPLIIAAKGFGNWSHPFANLRYIALLNLSSTCW